jgi:thiamine-phosphate pyrophosphorylase
MKIPALYPILDADAFGADCVGRELLLSVCANAVALADAGCTVLQLRAKRRSARELLSVGRELRRLLPNATLIMNDRADLCLAVGFDGVHVGQQDLSPRSARLVVGTGRIVGLSTHNAAQFAEALAEPVNYLAIGPVFANGGEQISDPCVGIAGVSEARQMLRDSLRDLPLVAFGGITRSNAKSVLQAGADAVIGDVSVSPSESAREFFRLMM